MPYKYEKTKHKDIHGNIIYIQVWDHGMIRYKAKCKQEVMQFKGRKWSFKTVSAYRDIDPAEAPGLFLEHPERFGGYVFASIRESMIQEKNK